MIHISEGPTKLRLTGDEAELRALAHSLRIRPKGFEHAASYKAFVLTDGRDGWDGYISPVRLRDREGDAVCLRGHKDALIEVAQKRGFALDLRDCLRSPFETIVSDDIPADIIAASFELDEYQRESVTYWLRHGMGVNKLAVNAGKTAAFAAAAAMIKRRFPDARILYVTQSERLVRQAFKDLRGFLPGYDITQYGGGRKDETGKDLVIATVAMLWTNREQLKRLGWFRGFMAVLVDESHHASSATLGKILMELPCFFRLGASDTKHESDPAKADKVRGLLGPVRYAVPVGVYIDMGRSAKPSIYLVRNDAWHNRHRSVPHQPEPGSPAWALVGNEWRHGSYVGPVYERDEDGKVVTRKVRELDGTTEVEQFHGDGTSQTVDMANWVEVEKPVILDGYHLLQFDGSAEVFTVDSRYCLLHRTMDKAIVTFKERNALIAEWTRYYSQERKFQTLVVCTRTMHILILETLIGEMLGKDQVRILFSDHTPSQRDDAFNWFRHTPGHVLISPLLKEGVSINEIRGGVIADYVGGWEPMNQLIGRFIRKKKGENEAHITAFIDVQHPALRRGSRRVFEKLHDVRGYNFYCPCLGPGTIGQAQHSPAL